MSAEIVEHGTVKISSDGILIENFSFKGDSTDGCGIVALEWALHRILEELKKIKEK